MHTLIVFVQLLLVQYKYLLVAGKAPRNIIADNSTDIRNNLAVKLTAVTEKLLVITLQGVNIKRLLAALGVDGAAACCTATVIIQRFLH